MSHLRLHNLLAIVTSSSSGIGRAIAIAYGKQGAKVVCGDLSPSSSTSPIDKATHEVIREDGEGSSVFVQVDISDSQSVKSMVDTAVETYGRLDVMVNNAGIGPEAADPQPVQDSSDERFEKTLRVNTFGTFYGCKHASVQMLRQIPQVDGSRGSIINMSSGLAVVASPGVPCYAASKGAVSSLTRAVAVDLGQHGIRCNAIIPGYVESPLTSKIASRLADAAPTGQTVKPDELAQVAVFLGSGDSVAMTGSQFVIDGGVLSYLRL